MNSYQFYYTPSCQRPGGKPYWFCLSHRRLGQFNERDYEPPKDLYDKFWATKQYKRLLQILKRLARLHGYPQ